jgi:hypothetical protein
MEYFECGKFIYYDDIKINHLKKLPSSLKLSTSSSEAVLLRLLSGNIKIQIENGKFLRIKNDYTKLAYTKTTNDSQPFNRILSGIFTSSDAEMNCNKYFMQNRKNVGIYDQMLVEISKYFINEIKSPTVAFVHLYRCLEFMSYSFPLIYASKSKDFMGSFTNLKNYLNGNSDGELKFFKNFANVLFSNEQSTQEYLFEMEINSPDLVSIVNDLKASIPPTDYVIDNGVIQIKFKHMNSFFISLRNRYFHNFVGQSSNNIKAMDYCIDDLFISMNSHFLNWISYIFITIIQHGYISTS